MVFPSIGLLLLFRIQLSECVTLPGFLAGKVWNIPCDLGNTRLHEVKQLIVSEKQAKLNRVVTLNLTILRISKRPVFLLLSLVHGKCYSNNDHKNNSGSRLQLLCFDSLNKREVNREEYRSKLSIKYRGLAPASLPTVWSVSYFNCLHKGAQLQQSSHEEQ